jgi:hypothetical protein
MWVTAFSISSLLYGAVWIVPLPNRGKPKFWRIFLLPPASKRIGGNNELDDQIIGAYPKLGLPSKRMPTSSVNTKKLVGQLMASIQTYPILPKRQKCMPSIGLNNE